MSWSYEWENKPNLSPIFTLKPEHVGGSLIFEDGALKVVKHENQRKKEMPICIDETLISHLTALRGDGAKDEYTKVLALGNTELSNALKRVMDDRRAKSLEVVALQIAELLEAAEKRKREAVEQIRFLRRQVAAAQADLQNILAAEEEAQAQNFIPLLKVVDPTLEGRGLLINVPDSVKNPVRARKVAAKKAVKA